MGAAADQAGLIPQVLPHRAAEPAFQTVREAWDVVQAKYVDHQALEPSRLSYAAIGGLLKSLGDGEHTRLLTPTELRAQADGLAGRLDGVGVQLALRDGKPTVVTARSGSPAQRAGLRSGDIVVSIDDHPVADLALDQVINLLRGPAGTPVSLTIRHATADDAT